MGQDKDKPEIVTQLSERQRQRLEVIQELIAALDRAIYRQRQLSHFTVFDIEPALFDRSCLRVKLRLGEVLQHVVRYFLVVPRYLSADCETQISCYLTAALV